MSTTFSVKLISPTAEINVTKVQSVSVNTQDGIEVFLAHHQSDSYHLAEGKCTLVIDQQYSHYAHSAGHVKFEDNILILSALKIKQL